MRVSYNQKRGRKGLKRTFQAHLRLQNISLKKEPPLVIPLATPRPKYHPTSNYRECTANDASSIPARRRLVKNRSVYWVGVPFTMVNMCVPGRWRVDGFAAAWHLIYGCMQGEELIKATSITQPDNLCTPGKNKWWLLASLNRLSHIFILFIYRGAVLYFTHFGVFFLPCPPLLHSHTVW